MASSKPTIQTKDLPHMPSTTIPMHSFHGVLPTSNSSSIMWPSNVETNLFNSARKLNASTASRNSFLTPATGQKWTSSTKQSTNLITYENNSSSYFQKKAYCPLRKKNPSIEKDERHFKIVQKIQKSSISSQHQSYII